MAENRKYKVATMILGAQSILGVSAARVLERVGLPLDFVENEGRGVDADVWFDLALAIAAETDMDDAALTIGVQTAKGPFQPALLSFSASPNVCVGLQRLNVFKPLVAPIRIDVAEAADTVRVTFHPVGTRRPVPQVTSEFEVVHFVELMRSFTAYRIVPLEVSLPSGDQITDALRAYLGAPVVATGPAGFVISKADAYRPLITADTAFYALIEKELTSRLRQLEPEAEVSERVRRVLIDLLPSGHASVEAVCSRLALSKRSLQRKLKEEGVTFQAVLDATRADLAITYLRDQNLSAEEISYLLAYRDPNSFYRAFHDWTGMTPAQARAAEMA